MKKLGYGLSFVGFLVGLSYITGYGYIWGGIQETYLRGWKNSNIDDVGFRDLRALPAAETPQPWPLAIMNAEILTDEDRAWHEAMMSASLLILHRDTICYEEYWMGHDESTVTNSFSACKTIVALAVGLASDEGLIDVHAEVAKYLPRFAGNAGMGLTVEELLLMRSHIPFGEDYNSPFGFMAKAYYRGNIRELVAPYKVADVPGSRWKYEGGNTMLLEEILTNVTGVSLSEYVSQGLWGPMGAEHDAFWGLDAPEDEGGVERCFAQFYCTTRDYARFGKLISGSGAWNGAPLISADYMNRLVSPVDALTDECDVNHYGYQIWLGKTDSGENFSCMEGLRGQMIISIPSLELIVVRTGYSKEKTKRGELPADIYRCIEMGLRALKLKG